FAYKMYMFGHHLDPEAPVKVAPFTPALFVTKQIANFTTHSGPLLGTYYIGVFLGGAGALLLWHLWAGRREAARAQLGEAQAANGSVGAASHAGAAPQAAHS